MGEEIKTSVIIPVYNTAEYLEECIDSVLAQTQKEIEIFLVDDGSTDGSLEIIDRYADKYPFIHKMTQEHMYQGTARNKGLMEAKGKYIYFMDSDDAILPELFETCYDICERMQLDFAIFDSYGFRYDENDTELKVPDDIVDRDLMGIKNEVYKGTDFWIENFNRHGILFVCWLHYIRRDFIMKYDLRYQERTYFEDNDWTARLYMYADRLFYLPLKLHRHRWRRNSNMLGGFTVELMEGCFNMHRVLLKLYLECSDDKQRHILSDTLRLNICRFDRLKEVDTEKGYAGPLEGFLEYLKEAMRDRTADRSAYYVHFAAAERILCALEDSGSPLYDRWKDMIGDTFRERHAVLWEDGLLGIYGLGRIGNTLMNILDKYAPDRKARTCFIHTKQESGGEFAGYSVYNVKDAPGAGIDIIVIGSIIYKDSIMEQIKQHFTEEVKIYTVPAEIKFLQDNYADLSGR